MRTLNPTLTLNPNFHPSPSTNANPDSNLNLDPNPNPHPDPDLDPDPATGPNQEHTAICPPHAADVWLFAVHQRPLRCLELAPACAPVFMVAIKPLYHVSKTVLQGVQCLLDFMSTRFDPQVAMC